MTAHRSVTPVRQIVAPTEQTTISTDLDEERQVARVVVHVQRTDGELAVRLIEIAVELSAGGLRELTLDLKSVAAIDSSTLGALVRIRNRLQGKTEFILANVNDSILGLFRLTRLDKIFVYEIETR